MMTVFWPAIMLSFAMPDTLIALALDADTVLCY